MYRQLFCIVSVLGQIRWGLCVSVCSLLVGRWCIRVFCLQLVMQMFLVVFLVRLLVVFFLFRFFICFFILVLLRFWLCSVVVGMVQSWCEVVGVQQSVVLLGLMVSELVLKFRWVVGLFLGCWKRVCFFMQGMKLGMGLMVLLFVSLCYDLLLVRFIMISFELFLVFELVMYVMLFVF